MKNDKCIIVALLGFVVIGMQIKKQDVKLASASTYPYGVGFCIDITKDSYFGNNFIVGAPIYKDTFLTLLLTILLVKIKVYIMKNMENLF